MEKITTVGLDLAKQVMAAHAVDADGRMVTRKVVRQYHDGLYPLLIAAPVCGQPIGWRLICD